MKIHGFQSYYYLYYVDVDVYWHGWMYVLMGEIK